jgi:hypothetical protein
MNSPTAKRREPWVHGSSRQYSATNACSNPEGRPCQVCSIVRPDGPWARIHSVLLPQASTPTARAMRPKRARKVGSSANVAPYIASMRLGSVFIELKKRETALTNYDGSCCVSSARPSRARPHPPATFGRSIPHQALERRAAPFATSPGQVATARAAREVVGERSSSRGEPSLDSARGVVLVST